MEDSKNRIPLQLSGGIITVPIRYELTHSIIEYLKQDLILFLENHKHAFALVFDLNGVKILDSDNFEELQKLIKMLSIMGKKVMLCGLASGIVSSIIDMEINVKNLATALDLNSALTALNRYK